MEVLGAYRDHPRPYATDELADGPPCSQGLRQRALIKVIQLTTHWEAVGELGDAHGIALKPFGDVVRGGLAFERGIHGQHHFVDAASSDPLDQLADGQVFRTNSVERRQAAA